MGWFVKEGALYCVLTDRKRGLSTLTSNKKLATVFEERAEAERLVKESTSGLLDARLVKVKPNKVKQRRGAIRLAETELFLAACAWGKAKGLTDEQEQGLKRELLAAAERYYEATWKAAT